MNWYRMKTVLIFLFLAINIFLAAMLGLEGRSKSRAARERIDAAIKALEPGGVTVACEVPHKTHRLGTLTLENLRADPADFSAKILGGTAARFGNEWRRNGKTVTIYAEGFSYESGAEAVNADKKSIKTMKETLETMGFSMAYAEGAVTDNTVQFVQTVHGVPLFGCVLAVCPAADGTVARMEGNWANIVESDAERATIGGAESALLSFLRESGGANTITEVSCGYGVLFAEEAYHSADAVPVWMVKTADGKCVFYDARQ
ncbi:MAG: hypothetical protein IJN25_10465 [Clostridia bacterium]|nr:hypothetical protein [Clostridia bacterium]